jgi:hypothetical protein
LYGTVRQLFHFADYVFDNVDAGDPVQACGGLTMEIFRQMQPLANDRAGNWPGAPANRRGTRRPAVARATAVEDKQERSAPADDEEERLRRDD